MATAEASNSSHVRHSRRRPFSTWMKRLTNLKSSSSSDSQSGSRVSGKRNNNNNNNNNNMLKSSNKRQNGCAKNNPYHLSGTIRDVGSPQSYNDTVSYTESTDAGQPQHEHHQSASQQSLQASTSEQNIPGNSAKSTAPTLSTNGDTARSEAGYSKTGTTVTGHGGVYGGGEGSTFSSPAPSVRSLTTTLTTVQSAAPSAHIYGIAQNNQNTNGPVAQNSLHQQNQFAHQFPPSPASAVPPHLAMTGHPTTYSSATANNILTDNASILTLASSSKRRRRNSLDTNASVRALAPSSVFGGSRESLPLSVLSANVGADASNASITNASGVLSRQSLVGLASAERISVYSASGTVPSLVHGGGGDRSSLIANKQGDNGSVRSGTHSHTRNDSAAGSVAGTIGSTLNNTTSAAMTSAATPGRISRRSSGWGEISGEGEEGGTHQQQQREIDQSSSEKTEEPNQENNSDPGPSIDEEPKQ